MIRHGQSVNLLHRPPLKNDDKLDVVIIVATPTKAMETVPNPLAQLSGEINALAKEICDKDTKRRKDDLLKSLS